MSVAPRLAGKCLSMLRLTAAGLRRLASRGDTLAAAWRAVIPMACSFRLTVEPWGWDWGGEVGISGGRVDSRPWGEGGELEAAAPITTLQPSTCTAPPPTAAGNPDRGRAPLVLGVLLDRLADLLTTDPAPLLRLGGSEDPLLPPPVVPSRPEAAGDDPAPPPVVGSLREPAPSLLGVVGEGGTVGPSGDCSDCSSSQGSWAWVASCSCSVMVDSSSSCTNTFLSTRSPSLLLDFTPLGLSSVNLHTHTNVSIPSEQSHMGHINIQSLQSHIHYHCNHILGIHTFYHCSHMYGI